MLKQSKFGVLMLVLLYGQLFFAMEESRELEIYKSSKKRKLESNCSSSFYQYTQGVFLHVGDYKKSPFSSYSAHQESEAKRLKAIVDKEIATGNGVQRRQGFPKLKQREFMDQETLSLALWHAVGQNDRVGLQAAVLAGADVNARNYDNTPLMTAVSLGYQGVIVDLVKNGADILAVNDFNHSPLMIAVKDVAMADRIFQMRQVLQFLGVQNLNAQDRYQEKFEILKFLLEKASDLKRISCLLGDQDTNVQDPYLLDNTTVYLEALLDMPRLDGLGGIRFHEQLDLLNLEYVCSLYNRYDQIAIKSPKEEKITRNLKDYIDSANCLK